jgi:hypothetical protein
MAGGETTGFGCGPAEEEEEEEDDDERGGLGLTDDDTVDELI